MKQKYFFLLIGIFLLATFLRFYGLNNYPVGFHIDEASLGYNAYSLLVTGKDDNNNFLPLYIDMFGDNRPSGYHFITMIPVKLFGLTVFATRFPAALFGSLSVFALFFLTFVFFKKKAIALLSALFLAIAPWHIVLSRASGEAVIALFFILIGFACLVLSLEKKQMRYVVLGGLLLVTSFFFYHTPRVFVPLLFFAYLIYFFWKFKKQVSTRHLVTMGATFLFVSFVAVALVFAVNGGTGRYTQVNIFSFPETKLVMQEQIREDGKDANTYITRLFHNKVTNYSLTFIEHYLEYFSGRFLYIKGGLPIWYQVPNMGLVYLVGLPLFLYGLLLLCISKQPLHKLILIWLLLAPVVASITVDDIPNINRVIVLFPMIEIITVFGLYTFLSKYSGQKKKIIIIGLSLLFFANFVYFLHQYFIHAAVHRTWYRNNGFEKMIQAVQASYDKVDKVFISKTAGGYPLVLFHMKFDPQTYQRAGSPKDKDFTGFGKFVFIPQDCPSVQKYGDPLQKERILFVDVGNCPDSKLLQKRKYDYILKEDGTRAFRIVYD